MTVTISSEDPRSIKAIEIAAGATQWLKVSTQDGRRAYGVPSQCQPGRYYLTTVEACDCADFRRYGLSTPRVGYAGEHHACKHILGVRLHAELVAAQQSLPKRQRPNLTVVPPTIARSRYEEIFGTEEEAF